MTAAIIALKSLRGRDRWAVRKAGAKRALKAGLSREDAWSEARRQARAVKTVAYLMGADGRVAERKDYSCDPNSGGPVRSVRLDSAA